MVSDQATPRPVDRVPGGVEVAGEHPQVLLDSNRVDVEDVARAALVEGVEVDADLVIGVDALPRRDPGSNALGSI